MTLVVRCIGWYKGFEIDREACASVISTSHDYTNQWDVGFGSRGNDPSAGSPTETLLRLHLPLNDEVYSTSQ